MSAQGEELDIDKLAPLRPRPEDNGFRQLVFVAGQVGSFPSELHPPAARQVVPGKAIIVSQMCEWSARGSQRARRTNITWAGVAEHIAERHSAVEAALEALQYQAFHGNLDYRRGFSMLLPHLSRMKGLAQVLSFAMLHDLHQGQPAAAFEKLNGLLALVDVLKDEPIIISQLVRIAVMHIACTATWEALHYDCWSDAQLAQLQKAWASYDFLPSMEKALSMERTIAVMEYERIRTSQLPLSAVLDPSWGFGATGPTPSLLSLDWVERMFDVREQIFSPLWKFAWSQQDELHYCQTVQSILEADRHARSQKSGAAMLARIGRLEEAGPGSPYQHIRFLVSRMISPALASSLRRPWVAQATGELAVAAIALRRYELRHHRLPTRLAALVPEFMERPPIDYMDGQPLRYCLDSDARYLLYSIGLNGIDEGGDATPTTNSSNPNYQNGRDLVWPQPASELETAVWKVSR